MQMCVCVCVCVCVVLCCVVLCVCILCVFFFWLFSFCECYECSVLTIPFTPQTDVPGKFRFEHEPFDDVPSLVHYYYSNQLHVTKKSEAILSRCFRFFFFF